MRSPCFPDRRIIPDQLSKYRRRGRDGSIIFALFGSVIKKITGSAKSCPIHNRLTDRSMQREREREGQKHQRQVKALVDRSFIDRWQICLSLLWSWCSANSTARPLVNKVAHLPSCLPASRLLVSLPDKQWVVSEIPNARLIRLRITHTSLE